MNKSLADNLDLAKLLIEAGDHKTANHVLIDVIQNDLLPHFDVIQNDLLSYIDQSSKESSNPGDMAALVRQMGKMMQDVHDHMTSPKVVTRDAMGRAIKIGKQTIIRDEHGKIAEVH